MYRNQAKPAVNHSINLDLEEVTVRLVQTLWWFVYVADTFKTNFVRGSNIYIK